MQKTYKWLSAFAAVVFPAWVVAQEMAVEKPVETVSTVYVVIFGLIFLGIIVGFFIRLWLNERKGGKQEQNQ